MCFFEMVTVGIHLAYEFEANNLTTVFTYNITENVFEKGIIMVN